VAPLTYEVMDITGRKGVTPVTVATRMAREKFLKIREENTVLTALFHFMCVVNIII
jgi:hypothetical protein